MTIQCGDDVLEVTCDPIEVNTEHGNRCYVSGLRTFYINGQAVSPEAFERRLAECQGTPVAKEFQLVDGQK